MTVTARIGSASRICRLRPDAGELVAGWLELHRAVADASTVPAPAPCPVDLVGSLRFAPPETTAVDWVAVDRGGSVTGWLRLQAPVDAGEPPEPMAVAALVVHPRARGRGVANQLVGWCFAEAGRCGVTEVRGSFRAPSDDDWPASVRQLMEDAGGEVTGYGRNLLLELPDDGGSLPEPPLPAGFRLLAWGSAIPDEYVVAASALEVGAGRAPLPDVQACADPSAQQTAYLRRFEVMRLGRGRRAVQTGVLDPDGQLVGFSSLSMTREEPTMALQGMTVVHQQVRGLGLGRTLKLANLRRAQCDEPRLRRIVTGNDRANGPMLAVNEALGFRVVDSEIFWRVRLAR